MPKQIKNLGPKWQIENLDNRIIIFSFCSTVIERSYSIKGAAQKSCPTAERKPGPPRKEYDSVAQPKKRKCYKHFEELCKRTAALKLKGWVFEEKDNFIILRMWIEGCLIPKFEMTIDRRLDLPSLFLPACYPKIMKFTKIANVQ